MNSKKGFTLVELLIVIAIIAILGGIMLTQFSGSTESALASNCLNNMRSLCNAVLAQASRDNYYPSAGPFKYLVLDESSDDYSQERWFQGWVGYDLSDQPVSCYYEPSGDGRVQYDAITNGTIWRVMNGARAAYVCPSHVKHCSRGRHPTPAWSYAMNSFFGWNSSAVKLVAGERGGRRGYGNGSFSFSYSSSPTSRSRSAERVLLFAEIPFVDNGVQHPDYSTGASPANDAILQYKNDQGGVEKANRPSDGVAEAIGFNHKSGADYSAHVAFADGHCVKLTLPRAGSLDNIIDLTTWLCTGQDYIFNGSAYTKVNE